MKEINPTLTQKLRNGNLFAESCPSRDVLKHVTSRWGVLILVALVYILEALSVMIQVTYFKYTKKKYGEGRRIFKMTPIHHHFEMSGFSEYKIVITFSLFGLIAGAVGLLLVTL